MSLPLVDRHCDVNLSDLGMVMHGFESTVPVTLDMMILQGHAVMRGSKRALVVVDPTCRSRWRKVRRRTS